LGRVICTLVLLTVALIGLEARAGYTEGMQAYEATRFEDAMQEFRRLAARGHAGAEFMLGVMYFQGQGLNRDQSIAGVWFYKSALKGHAGAQLALGSIHIRGIGVYQDLSEAYKWLTLAAERGVGDISQKALALRKDAALLMTPDEIAEAVSAAKDFNPIQAGLVRD